MVVAPAVCSPVDVGEYCINLRVLSLHAMMLTTQIPPLFVIVCFTPMSPWWLVRNNRLEEAEAALRRLTNPEFVSEQDIKDNVAMMVHTNEMERNIQEGTSYIECFKGVDRRRTEASMMVFAMQLLSGQNLVGQGVQFLQQAGIKPQLSFSLNMVLNSMVSAPLLPCVARTYSSLLSAQSAPGSRCTLSAVARSTSSAWHSCASC